MQIPETIINAWKKRQGPLILATVDQSGVPNIIYATCNELFENECIIVADNYFSKTRENLKKPGKGSILFMSEDNKAYQLKGSLEYHSEGPIFDFMKTWNPEQHPGHAAAALAIEEAYSGAEKLL